MRAAVVTAFDRPLDVQERPVPEPGPGEVLVRIEACGLCRTDANSVRGDGPVRPAPPFVPGHEGVGVVRCAGPGVPDGMVGRRVGLAWLGSACGRCRHCVTGRENLCDSRRDTGGTVDGTLAEYALADARFVVPVPDDIPSAEAAPLCCAGVSALAAVKAARVCSGDRVAVFGIGSLGQLAVQYARLNGALVFAVDVTWEKLDLALDLGADRVVHAAEGDPVAALTRFGGVDVAIVMTPAPGAAEQALASLRSGGRLVLAALPAWDRLDLSIADTVLRGITVVGSIVGTRQDLAEAFELHAAGRTRITVETHPLAAAADLLEKAFPGADERRLVIDVGMPDEE